MSIKTSKHSSVRWAVNLLLPLSLFSSTSCLKKPESDLSSKTVPQKKVSVSKPDTAKRALKAYQDLQHVSYNRARFLSDSQDKKIASLLREFSEQTINIHRGNSEFSDDPSFKIQLRILFDESAQTYRHFLSGRKEYALGLLRSLDANCSSCHISHGVKGPVRSSAPPEEAKMSELDRAEFFLTRRENDKGEELLREAIIKSEEIFERGRAMDLLARFYVSSSLPTEEISQRLTTLKTQVLEDSSEFERISKWQESLKSIDRTASPKVDEIIEKLDTLSEELTPAREEKELEILRIEQGLHEILAGDSLKEPERKQARCALGRTYDLLPSPLYDSLAKRCLIFCIEKYPGTSESRDSFTALRRRVLLGYTGSSGTNVPDVVKNRLKELNTIAKAR